MSDDKQDVHNAYTHISMQYDGCIVVINFKALNADFLLIVWDGKNYPYKEINNMRKWCYNYKKQKIIPYMLYRKEVGLIKHKREFINQELVNYRKGILILQRIRLSHLLKKISYKYWYEVLNDEGLSRMCLLDVINVKLI